MGPTPEPDLQRQVSAVHEQLLQQHALLEQVQRAPEATGQQQQAAASTGVGNSAQQGQARAQPGELQAEMQALHDTVLLQQEQLAKLLGLLELQHDAAYTGNLRSVLPPSTEPSSETDLGAPSSWEHTSRTQQQLQQLQEQLRTLQQHLQQQHASLQQLASQRPPAAGMAALMSKSARSSSGTFWEAQIMTVQRQVAEQQAIIAQMRSQAQQVRGCRIAQDLEMHVCRCSAP
jgi:hypothetical protein